MLEAKVAVGSTVEVIFSYPISGIENANRKSEGVCIYRMEGTLRATGRLLNLLVFVSKWQGQLPPKVS